MRPLASLPGPPFSDDPEDDVLNDILSRGLDPQSISPPRQMDRLTSRFASQSLGPEPANFGVFPGVGSFETDPIRRETTAVSQFFPPGPPGTHPANTSLFEHPVGPQPSLPTPSQHTTRVMVMADKLKWVYKDPQGNIQGPFTGLEMHEWYRGGYFHATLEVKREEDAVFDQLQNLVKRIGNQREPFLVPLPSRTQTQVIPPRSTTTLSGWNTTLFGEGYDEGGKGWNIVTPSLQGTGLPGTTLTADQQNALERRKQEEQYMLARQREMAATQQQLTHPSLHPLQPPPAQHAYVGPPYATGFGPMHPLPLGVTQHIHTPASVQVQTLPALDTLRTGSSPVPPVQSQPQTSTQQMQSTLDRPGLQYQSVQHGGGLMSPWGAGPLGPLSPGAVQMQPPQSQETLNQEYAETTMASPLQQEDKINIPGETPLDTVDAIPEPVVPEIVDESPKLSTSVISAKADVAYPTTTSETLEVLDETPEPESIVHPVASEPIESEVDAAAEIPSTAAHSTRSRGTLGNFSKER